MGDVVRFIPKSELARLIRKARTKYESIFPDGEGPRQAGSSTAHAGE